MPRIHSLPDNSGSKYSDAEIDEVIGKLEEDGQKYVDAFRKISAEAVKGRGSIAMSKAKTKIPKNDRGNIKNYMKMYEKMDLVTCVGGRSGGKVYSLTGLGIDVGKKLNE